jgi:hypothetical protein
MYCQKLIMLAVVLALGIAGCQKSGGTGGADAQSANKNATNSITVSGGNMQLSSASQQAANSATDGPSAAVREFLQAIKTGDDAKATQMLSTVAKEKTSALNRTVSPPASDTARFEVGKVEYRADDVAGVHCKWTDLDEKGEPQTDEAMWMVRREGQTWRIAGVAATIFQGEPPLLLNFEEPEDMIKKQQWVREEMQRRAAKPTDIEAKNASNPPESIRR